MSHLQQDPWVQDRTIQSAENSPLKGRSGRRHRLRWTTEIKQSAHACVCVCVYSRMLMLTAASEVGGSRAHVVMCTRSKRNLFPLSSHQSPFVHIASLCAAMISKFMSLFGGIYEVSRLLFLLLLLLGFRLTKLSQLQAQGSHLNKGHLSLRRTKEIYH